MTWSRVIITARQCSRVGSRNRYPGPRGAAGVGAGPAAGVVPGPWASPTGSPRWSAASGPGQGGRRRDGRGGRRSGGLLGRGGRGRLAGRSVSVGSVVPSVAVRRRRPRRVVVGVVVQTLVRGTHVCRIGHEPRRDHLGGLSAGSGACRSPFVGGAEERDQQHHGRGAPGPRTGDPASRGSRRRNAGSVSSPPSGPWVSCSAPAGWPDARSPHVGTFSTGDTIPARARNRHHQQPRPAADLELLARQRAGHHPWFTASTRAMLSTPISCGWSNQQVLEVQDPRPRTR